MAPGVPGIIAKSVLTGLRPLKVCVIASNEQAEEVQHGALHARASGGGNHGSRLSD